MSASTSSTYRQYKHGTEALLEWLSKSLDELGIAFGRNLRNSSIRSLLDFACQAQKKGASMPFNVRYALEDALKIRRQYHAWYSRQLCQRAYNEDNKHIEHSNEAHAAFIDVLQDIHDLFAQHKSQEDQLPSSTSSDKILEISNLFANLEAGDMTVEKAQVPMAKPSADSERPAKPWMVRKSQMLVEDRLLELYCLFDDASKIRGYLRKTWDEYASRKIDIISAAMITQEALELFSEAEKTFEDKYGKIPKDRPNCFQPKHLDILYHLAIGEPMTSTYTSDEFASKSASEIEVEQLQEQSRVEKRKQRILKSGWVPSEDLNHWLMRPTMCVLDRMLGMESNKGGAAWILEQALRKPADRANALSALGFDEDLDCVPEATAQEHLGTFIDVYAGMIFMQQNPGTLMGSPDIVTSQWLGNYDCSIRMALSMQILHDIRTANSGSGQLTILNQVSEDYKRLGSDMAILDETLGQSRLVKHDTFRRLVDEERSWLQGRAPGRIRQPRNISKAKSQKLSELPLVMNPILVGMILFDKSFNMYHRQITFVNNKWSLIPCAHLLNWLTLRDRGGKAVFQDLWPDMHTALGLIGPRQIWLGSSPPETLGNCRNRMLLAWGLQLNDFYQRILSGDIPKVEELFRKIKNNTNDRVKVTEEVLESMINGEVQLSETLAKWKSTEGLSHPLKIETSQSTPLLDAIKRNLHSSNFMNAQQKHIRKILLASGKPRKSSEELDMLSYLDAFSSTTRAEVPRMIFPYGNISRSCAGLSMGLFICYSKHMDLPQEVRQWAVLDNPEGLFQAGARDDLRSGAQSAGSVLALTTIFGCRVGSQAVERLMLNFIENDWDEEIKLLSRDHFTKEFVGKCKEFGFAVPECATAALV